MWKQWLYCIQEIHLRSVWLGIVVNVHNLFCVEKLRAVSISWMFCWNTMSYTSIARQFSHRVSGICLSMPRSIVNSNDTLEPLACVAFASCSMFSLKEKAYFPSFQCSAGFGSQEAKTSTTAQPSHPNTMLPATNSIALLRRLLRGVLTFVAIQFIVCFSDEGRDTFFPILKVLLQLGIFLFFCFF